MIGDIVAELFGFKAAKKIMWVFFSNLAFCIFAWAATTFTPFDA